MSAPAQALPRFAYLTPCLLPYTKDGCDRLWHQALIGERSEFDKPHPVRVVLQDVGGKGLGGGVLDQVVCGGRRAGRRRIARLRANGGASGGRMLRDHQTSERTAGDAPARPDATEFP